MIKGILWGYAAAFVIAIIMSFYSDYTRDTILIVGLIIFLYIQNKAEKYYNT